MRAPSVLWVMFNLMNIFVVQAPNMVFSSSIMMEETSADATFELLGDIVRDTQVVGQQIGPDERLIAHRTREDPSGASAVLVFMMPLHVPTIREDFATYWTCHADLRIFLLLVLVCKSTTANQHHHLRLILCYNNNGLKL